MIRQLFGICRVVKRHADLHTHQRINAPHQLECARRSLPLTCQYIGVIARQMAFPLKPHASQGTRPAARIPFATHPQLLQRLLELKALAASKTPPSRPLLCGTQLLATQRLAFRSLPSPRCPSLGGAPWLELKGQEALVRSMMGPPWSTPSRPSVSPISGGSESACDAQAKGGRECSKWHQQTTRKWAQA